MTVLDYHRHGTDGQNIVICGGGLSGCDAAIELHGEGKNVSIIEMQDDIARTRSSSTALPSTSS